jgi:hypothetical protein
MTSRNQNNIFHLFDAQSKSSSKDEPGIDVLDHPLTEISPRKGIVTLSIYGKIQCRTASSRLT